MSLEKLNLEKLPRVDLQNYTSDKGSAYFGQPALGVLLFPASYTLTWQTDRTDSGVISNYSSALKDISGEWLRYKHGLSGDLVVSTVIDPTLDKSQSLIEQSLRYGISANSVSSLDKSVSRFLFPRWPKTVSFMASLGYKDDKFKLWSEGPATNYDRDDEIGLEAPLSFFSAEFYAKLMKNTGTDFRNIELERITAFMDRVKREHCFGK